MEKEKLEHYRKAGKTIQDARKKAREAAEPGKNLRTIAEQVESLIREQGLEPAFPVNLSINEQAAHYTPGPDEERRLRPDDVLKIDIGAHSEGYIADTALTVNPSGEHSSMIKTAEELLEQAIDFVEPGKTIGEFGTFVENQVPEEYHIVRNLTGHYIGRYEQHAGVSVPNYRNSSNHVFKEGDAVAIEPFLSTGSGKMKNGEPGNIYRLKSGNVRSRAERSLKKELENFNGLPFTTRWIDTFSGRKKMALKKLVNQDIVHSYPILRDREGATVVQAEHTIIVQKDGNIVTTRG